MSEKVEENKEPEVSVVFTGKEDQISIEFADGVHQLPDYVISGIGGADKLKPFVPGLKQKTYQEFLAGFRRTVEKRDLNEFQRGFVANHFGRRF